MIPPSTPTLQSRPPPHTRPLTPKGCLHGGTLRGGACLRLRYSEGQGGPGLGPRARSTSEGDATRRRKACGRARAPTTLTPPDPHTPLSGASAPAVRSAHPSSLGPRPPTSGHSGHGPGPPSPPLPTTLCPSLGPPPDLSSDPAHHLPHPRIAGSRPRRALHTCTAALTGREDVRAWHSRGIHPSLDPYSPIPTAPPYTTPNPRGMPAWGNPPR